MTTDYEKVAHGYDQRYANNEYPGTETTLRAFLGAGTGDVLELGCGTGHWIAWMRGAGWRARGIDPSRGMLSKARAKCSDGLSLARAEQLPFSAASFDRVVMVNALHHVPDPQRALREARRVLRAGGAFLSIGLDPSQARDRWCIYDYFPGTYPRDLERYPAAAQVRSWLSEAGFTASATTIAERIVQSHPAREALRAGLLAKHITSQLSELSDERYAGGLAAIESAALAAEAEGKELRLEAELFLFATTAQVPSSR